MRRVFTYDTVDTNRSAFEWKILSHFPKFGYPSYNYGSEENMKNPIKDDSEWMLHQNCIILDYTGAFSGPPRQITSMGTLNILKEIGLLHCEPIQCVKTWHSYVFTTDVKNYGNYYSRGTTLPPGNVGMKNKYSATLEDGVINNMSITTSTSCQGCKQQCSEMDMYGIKVDGGIIMVCAICTAYDENIHAICVKQRTVRLLTATISQCGMSPILTARLLKLAERHTQGTMLVDDNIIILCIRCVLTIANITAIYKCAASCSNPIFIIV
jgi:hypothetical protein